jgi:hypothetical protein
MTFLSYLAGLAVCGAVFGLAALAAWLLLRRWLADLRGSPRAVAFLLLATTAILLAYLLPGVLGVLSRGTVVIAAAVLGAACWAASGRPRPRRPPIPGPRLVPRISWSWPAIGAALAAAMLGVVVLAALLERAPVPATNVDALNFHLPGVAAWIQSGSLWQVNQYLPNLAHGNYPQNGDMLLMASILPWHNDAFVRLVSVPLLGWAGLSVYAASLEVGAPRPGAILAGALFASLPAVLHPAALEVLTDPLMLAAMGSGLLFLLRHWRTRSRADLALAGLGLGVAFGTKWYGVSAAIAVFAVWALSWLAARRGPALLLRAGGVLAGLIALAGGFWLLRNLVESGDPLFPVRVAPFGVTIFDAPFDKIRAQAGFTIAHYLGQPEIVGDYIVPGLWRGLALGGLVFAAGVAAVLVVGPVRRSRIDPRLLMLAALAVVLAVVYVITPYTALGAQDRPIGTQYNVRYLMPAMLAAAPLTAWLIGRWTRLAPALAALLLVAEVDSLRRTADEIGARPLVEALAVVVIVAAVALLVLRAGRALPRGPWLPGAVAVVIGCGVFLGQGLQSRFNDGRYRNVDPVLESVLTDAPSGHHIGLVGYWGVTRLSPVWPLFGQRIGNEVRYVGPFRQGMLRNYRTRSAFLDGLRRQGDDLLVIARGEPPLPAIKQDRWVRAAGYRQIARGDRLTLYAAPVTNAS